MGIAWLDYCLDLNYIKFRFSVAHFIGKTILLKKDEIY